MNAKDRTCEEFTLALASDAPTPGGGGASALAAALGIALGHMVGALTVGKEKYADVEDDVKELMERMEALQGRFLSLIDEDAKAFTPLAKAYGMPAETVEEKGEKDRVMEECLKVAVEAPLTIFDLTCEALEIMDQMGQKGSRMVLSDVATGVAFLQGALEGAAINVRVNTKLMKDQSRAVELNGHIDEGLAVYVPKAQEIYRRIEETMHR